MDSSRVFSLSERPLGTTFLTTSATPSLNFLVHYVMPDDVSSYCGALLLV